MPEIIETTHAREAGHWYDIEGKEAHTLIGKNGKERNVTLRDARTMKLFPSVTSIMRCADKPGLTNWMIDQAILSALTLPRLPDEIDTAYFSRIKSDAKEQAKRAAERGTLIHSWVQGGFEGKYEPVRQTMVDLEDERLKYYDSAKKTINAECGPMNWISEKSFCRARYGGKVDLHNDTYVLDIKTTDKDLETIKTWDEHAMQLAAYDYGIGAEGRKCGILYIHKETAESKIIWISNEDMQKGFNCFMALRDFWYYKTGLETP